MLSAAHRILLFGGRRLSFAGQALLAETAGLAFDARDMSAAVKGHTANFGGDANSLFTYSSPSTKYVRNSAGLLVPGTTMRCDHDASGNKLGLLIEEQRTNLLTRSSEIDNAAWTKSGAAITADQIAAPDGNTAADLFTENTASSAHAVYNGFSATSGTTYTVSVFVKAGTQRYICLRGEDTDATAGQAWPWITLDTQTGTIAANGSVTSSSVTAYANGWYRISLTFVSGVTGTNNLVIAGGSSSAAPATNISLGPSYLGTSQTFYVWGAQLEAGSFPTSYIPTAGSQVTRAADTITLATSAFPLNAAAGTLVVNVSWLAGSTVSPNNAMAAVLSDTTSGERIILYNISGNAGYAMIDGGSTVASGQNGAPVAANVQANIGVAYELNSTIGAINGGLTSLDTSCTIPDFTRLSIGSSHTGVSASVNGHVLRLSYRPRRVSDTELQALSA